MQKPVVLAAATVGVVAIAAIAWYAMVAISNSNNPGSSAGSSPTPTPAVSASVTPTNSAAPTISPTPTVSDSRSTKEFKISGTGHSFSVTKLTVDQGDKVKVVFTSTDIGHTFTLPQFSVDTGLVGAGQTKTVEFVASKKGSFEFYCTPHRSMGMTGTLVVE
jgi:plastocyanin